jgi:hypothetical protein
MNAAQARQIPILNLLSHFGFKPNIQKQNQVWFISPLRPTEKTPSFKVDLLKNLWYDHGLGQGGNALDLAARLLNNSDIPQILAYLRSHNFGTAQTTHTQPILPFDKESENLPAAEAGGPQITEVIYLQHPSLIQYVEKRCIPFEIAKRWLREIHYVNAGRKWFALGFENDRGGYEIRSPMFKGAIQPKAPTTILRNTGQLVVFEGFMDFLSWMVLSGELSQHRDVLVLNSIVFVSRVEKLLTQYTQIELFLDNDDSGKRVKQEFPPHCIDRSIDYSNYKDLNEYLCKGH